MKVAIKAMAFFGGNVNIFLKGQACLVEMSFFFLLNCVIGMNIGKIMVSRVNTRQDINLEIVSLGPTVGTILSYGTSQL